MAAAVAGTEGELTAATDASDRVRVGAVAGSADAPDSRAVEAEPPVGMEGGGKTIGASARSLLLLLLLLLLLILLLLVLLPLVLLPLVLLPLLLLLLLPRPSATLPSPSARKSWRETTAT